MAVYYSIRVQGHLDRTWSEWFDGLTIAAVANGESVLTGEIIDQAALYGVLNRVRDLGLPLLAVRAHAPGPARDQPKRHAAPWRRGQAGAGADGDQPAERGTGYTGRRHGFSAAPGGEPACGDVLSQQHPPQAGGGRPDGGGGHRAAAPPGQLARAAAVPLTSQETPRTAGASRALVAYSGPIAEGEDQQTAYGGDEEGERRPGSGSGRPRRERAAATPEEGGADGAG